MIAPFNSPMDNVRLEQILRRECDSVVGDPGNWQCLYAGARIWVITDEGHNRMRMMTPVVDEELVSLDECRILLEANFDRALDAKFAISHGQLWSVFVHPNPRQELWIQLLQHRYYFWRRARIGLPKLAGKNHGTDVANHLKSVS